jgi:iron(III) transport system ATP-binding protein
MLKVSGLTKVYANVSGVAGGIRDANFDLAAGTFYTLLGPSGCGKTTTLRCIAGLEQPNEGQITVNDRVLFDNRTHINVPLNHRHIGMVFQSYAIWPHMTVFENVSFPLRVSKQKRYAREDIEKMVEEALTTVGLNGYQDRSATRLSGGQQQRVALARAIVHRPKLLLLDEPLSNLDATLRDEMRSELKRLQQQIGITAVYVTHDQSEALAMSDQIAVINQGRIIQQGSPWEVYFKPANEFVASFIGQTNLLRGKLAGSASGDGVHEVLLDSGTVIRSRVGRIGSANEAVVISVRPENITIARASDKDGADANVLNGHVRAASFLGNMVRHEIGIGDMVLTVESNPSHHYEQGSQVKVMFRPEDSLAVPVDA